MPIGEKKVWLFSAWMMSRVWVWVDLDLFTAHFSDKVLLDTWNLKEKLRGCE